MKKVPVSMDRYCIHEYDGRIWVGAMQHLQEAVMDSDQVALPRSDMPLPRFCRHGIDPNGIFT